MCVRTHASEYGNFRRALWCFFLKLQLRNKVLAGAQFSTSVRPSGRWKKIWQRYWPACGLPRATQVVHNSPQLSTGASLGTTTIKYDLPKESNSIEQCMGQQRSNYNTFICIASPLPTVDNKDSYLLNAAFSLCRFCRCLLKSCRFQIVITFDSTSLSNSL